MNPSCNELLFTILTTDLPHTTFSIEVYVLRSSIESPRALFGNQPMRLLVQAFGARVRTQFDRPWSADELRQGQLVVIAEHDDINPSAIRTILSA